MSVDELPGSCHSAIVHRARGHRPILAPMSIGAKSPGVALTRVALTCGSLVKAAVAGPPLGLRDADEPDTRPATQAAVKVIDA